MPYFNKEDRKIINALAEDLEEDDDFDFDDLDDLDDDDEDEDDLIDDEY